MTTQDYSIIRGDSLIQQFTLVDDQAPTPQPIDLTTAIVKYTAKPDPDETNTAGDVVFKATYDALQIEKLDAVNGVILLKYEKADTDQRAVGDVLHHDLEVTLKGEARPAAAIVGTLTLTAGGLSVVGVGTKFKLLRRGDYLIPAGATSPNQKPFTVQKVVDDTHLVVDYPSFVAESAVPFTAFVGAVNTPMTGTLTITEDTTR